MEESFLLTRIIPERRALGSSPQPSLLKPKCKARWWRAYGRAVRDEATGAEADEHADDDETEEASADDDNIEEASPFPVDMDNENENKGKEDGVAGAELAAGQVEPAPLPALADPARVKLTDAVMETASAKSSRIVDEIEHIFVTVHREMSREDIADARDALSDSMDRIHEAILDFACKSGQMMRSFPDKSLNLIKLTQHLDSAARAICTKLEQMDCLEENLKRRKRARQG